MQGENRTAPHLPRPSPSPAKPRPQSVSKSFLKEAVRMVCAQVYYKVLRRIKLVYFFPLKYGPHDKCSCENIN